MKVITKTVDLVAESGDEMVVGGLITAQTEDRHSDIVMSAGVNTEHLKVLLENHDHTKPVGTLLEVEHRTEGTYARFKVASAEAWQKIKDGLYPSFSIGFLPLKSEPRKKGGWVHNAIEILECSLVAVPSCREAQILEVRNARSGQTNALEADNMNNDSIAPRGTVVAPAVHTKVHEYSLQKAMKSILDQRVPTGMEGEVDSDLRAAQPWRDFGGCAVPIAEIFLTQKQKREIEKASGVYIPNNLGVLTGTEHRDELLAVIDDAIGKQTLMGQAGVRVLSGLTEDTVRIPRQTAMMSASHVAIDTDLQASDDPAFSNADLRPRFVGSISELSMSAILAQHPRIGTDYIGNEMRRGLTQELERAFLNGDNTTNPEEPDGLISLADDTSTLAAATATAQADILAAARVMDDYLQDRGNITWLLDNEFWDSLQQVTLFDGTGYTVDSWMVMDNRNRIIPCYNLPGTTTRTGFFGDFSYFVHGIWEAADVSLNPYADSVFAKKSTLLRVSMLHDYQAIDPKRMLQLATTAA